jgi:hypothetical protein
MATTWSAAMTVSRFGAPMKKVIGPEQLWVALTFTCD